MLSAPTPVWTLYLIYIYVIYLLTNLYTFFGQDVRVYREEVELDGRDPQQDYIQYKETCQSLANLMSEIQELKANGAKDGVRMCHYMLI